MKILDQSILSVMMIGSTHYIDLNRGADAVIYYESDRIAHMRLPGSENVLHGEWSARPDGWFVKWHGGPEGNWHIRHSTPARFEYLDGNKEPRGVVTRIVPGDAERIAA
jgi:hypothetical protein